MGNLQCKWVRDRLPLLAGNELRGADLRRVERHLIGCAPCREHRSSLGQALKVLHLAAAYPPVSAEAPSLWPSLARQIRHSRPPAQAPLFAWSRRFGLWPAYSFAGACLLAIAVTVGPRGQGTDSQFDPHSLNTAANHKPAPAEVVKQVPEPIVASHEPSESPEPASEAITAFTESVPSARIGYDLDHTIPMPSGRESRDTTRQPTTY